MFGSSWKTTDHELALGQTQHLPQPYLHEEEMAEHTDDAPSKSPRLFGLKKLAKQDALERRRERRSGESQTHEEWLRSKPPIFLRACELAGVSPSYRQASKWRRDEGKARRFMQEAINQLNEENKK